MSSDDIILRYASNQNVRGGIATGMPSVTPEERATYYRVRDELIQHLNQHYGDHELIRSMFLPQILAELACQAGVRGGGKDAMALILDNCKESLDWIEQNHKELGIEPLY